MLMNVARIAREQLQHAVLRVSADAPSWLAKEFDLTSSPGLIHLWGRWQSIASRFRLPANVARTLAPLYRTACTLCCAALVIAPRAIRSRVPGMEGEFIDAVANARLVYFTGGGYLTDAGKVEARAVLQTALLARLRGSRIVMTGQGIGPFNTYWTQCLMRLVATRCDVLTTRESQEAARWFRRWRLPQAGWQGGVDDACSLPYPSPTPPSHGRILAIHFRVSPFHTNGSKVSSAFVEIIRSHLELGYAVKLFVFQEHTEAEIKPYAEWLSALRSDAVTIVRDTDPRVLRAHLAGCNRAVGLAYHFLLFALMSGIPAIATYDNEYYRAKFAGLAQLFGQPDALIPTSQFDAPRILQKLAAMDAGSNSKQQAVVAQQYATACDRQIVSALRCA